VLSVFILPPSLEALESRLKARGGDDPAEIARRMHAARSEISHWAEFDHVVINDDLEHAIDSVRSVLHAGRVATQRQPGLKAFVERLG
jgi:guanylate kinase